MFNQDDDPWGGYDRLDKRFYAIGPIHAITQKIEQYRRFFTKEWDYCQGMIIVIFNDGDTAHIACAAKHQEDIENAIRHGERNHSGWYPMMVEEFLYGSPEICCICNEIMESTYGE